MLLCSAHASAIAEAEIVRRRPTQRSGWAFEYPFRPICPPQERSYYRNMGNHENRPSSNSTAPPGFGGVLETALYVADLEAAERFYGDVLGLAKIFSVPGRHLAFRSQESVLLIFNPQHTERERIIINGGTIPLHGSHGSGHAAFRVAKGDFDAWREHFRAAGVAVESEVSWPNGAHSIYFRDPAGNSLELATPDMWTNMSA
jgi:catechol 2,3-dioxygenase-like lactoylglutathione lyase family enzyme